jgi:hypothetical protein
MARARLQVVAAGVLPAVDEEPKEPAGSTAAPTGASATAPANPLPKGEADPPAKDAPAAGPEKKGSVFQLAAQMEKRGSAVLQAAPDAKAAVPAPATQPAAQPQLPAEKRGSAVLPAAPQAQAAAQAAVQAAALAAKRGSTVLPAAPAKPAPPAGPSAAAGAPRLASAAMLADLESVLADQARALSATTRCASDVTSWYSDSIAQAASIATVESTVVFAAPAPTLSRNRSASAAENGDSVPGLVETVAGLRERVHAAKERTVEASREQQRLARALQVRAARPPRPCPRFRLGFLRARSPHCAARALRTRVPSPSGSAVLLGGPFSRNIEPPVPLHSGTGSYTVPQPE